MTAYDELVAEFAQEAACVTFGGITDSLGGEHTCSTKDWSLIPTEPLYFEPFEESTSSLTIYGIDGSLYQPEPCTFDDYGNPIGGRRFDNATGSWDFYYCPDDKRHTVWDGYAYDLLDAGTVTQEGIKAFPWNFFGVYHEMLRWLQGRRCSITVKNSASDAGETFAGRAWVSKVMPDASGQTTVTISYEIEPGSAHDSFISGGG